VKQNIKSTVAIMANNVRNMVVLNSKHRTFSTHIALQIGII